MTTKKTATTCAKALLAASVVLGLCREAHAVPSCYSNCGSYAGEGKWCDTTCKTHGDCAVDYDTMCGTIGACNRSGANTYILHVNGMCSTGWDTSFATTSVGRNVNVRAVQTEDTSRVLASQAVKRTMDQCCRGDDQCFVINYSAGDIATGRALSVLGSGYNIVWVGSSAGAGGGSELDVGELANVAEILDLTPCEYSNELGVTEVRNAYNHDDTDGEVFYRIAGNDGWAYTAPVFGDFLFDIGGTQNDGAVAYHSAGGWRSDWWDKDEEDLCSYKRFTNYSIAWSCSGYELDHEEMQTKFLRQMNWLP